MTEPGNELDWNTDKHGRMRDYATDPDNEPATEVFVPPLEGDD